MYQVSDSFHQAIRDGKPQMPLFVFDDCVITAQDLNIEEGIHFTESIGDCDDFAPGGTPSSQISFSLMNDEGLFTDYEFTSEFKAMIGVLTKETVDVASNLPIVKLPTSLPFTFGSGTMTSEWTSKVVVQGMTVTGHDTVPYLRIQNGTVTDTGFPVNSLVAYNGVLYAIGDESVKRYDIGFGTLTVSTGDSEMDYDLMDNKLSRWNENKFGIVMGYSDEYSTAPNEANSLTIYADGMVYTYEFCPLGVFHADRPSVSSKKIVSVEGYDRMTKMDDEWVDSVATYWGGTNYSMTALVKKICQYVGVPYNRDNTIPNGTKVLTSKPSEFEDATLRDILSWIGQVTCCYTHFDRDGQLELRWIKTVNDFQLDPGDYMEYDESYYDAPNVNRVVVINNNGSNLKATTATSNYSNLYLKNNPIAIAWIGGANA